MANVTQSLFGFTPQDIQAQRDAEMQRQALQFARLSPLESARMGLFQGITQLGNAAGAALGYEDPEMAQARARQGLLGGLDMNDPESLLKAAQSVQATDPQAALALVNQANTLKGTQADINKKKYKMEQEQITYQNRFSALKAKFPEISDAEARGIAMSEASFNEIIKVPKVDTQVVEAGGRQLLINKKDGTTIADIGAAPDRRSVTEVNLGGPDTTVKAFEVADADALKNLRTAASAASGQLGFIAQARDQVQNAAVAGTGIPTVVRGLNAFLAPLGINTDQVAKTRNLEQALNSIIAQGIKQYGANPSTADLEFAKRASASITDPKQAIAETLDYLEERAQALINKSTAADDYLLRNKNLGGFEQFWASQQRNKNNPPTQPGVRKTKSGVSYTVSPQN